MNTIKSVVAAAALTLFGAAAFAQAASTPKVDNRQDRQEARIQQGAASGTLTAREQRKLERQQKSIANAEERAKADGTVTKQERAKLHHRENKASRDIKRQKHDAQASAPKP